MRVRVFKIMTENQTQSASVSILNMDKFNHKISDFVVFKERLKQSFIANKIEDSDRQKAILLCSLSEETYILLRNLCTPYLPDSKSYDELIRTLNDFFAPVKSVFAERLKFYTARKMEKESVSEWSARIKSLAANCSFGNELETVIRDVFTIGLGENNVRDRCFEENPTITLSKMIQIAQAKESVMHEISNRFQSDLNIKTETVNYFKNKNSRKTSRYGFSTQSGSSKQVNISPNMGYRNSSQGNSPQLAKCSVCGRKNHKSSDCSFRNCICHKCNTKGHLASVCKKKTSRNHNFIEEENNEMPIFNLGDVSFDHKGNAKPIYVKLIVENIPLNFEADSGFAYTAISEKCYLKYFKNKQLFTNDLTLKDYIGVTFEPMGYLNLKVVYEQNEYVLKVYIIRNGGPPLIGRNGLNLLNLGICKIRYIDNDVDNSTKSITELINKFKNIFDNSLGTFNKQEIHLRLKDGAVPKFFKARPVPFALKPKIEDEVERLVKNGVLVPVEFSDWATPIVPIIKPNGNVRICGDFKVTINQYLVVQQYPIPRIEYLFSQLHGGDKFSKIDLSEAYQQVLLTEESRKFVTISTHKGLFSYTRLPYGITSAPSIFQKIMEQMFVNLPGVVCCMDDILVTGRNDQEHLSNLRKVLLRLEESGLKVKKEKCAFFQSCVKYLGHIIDKNGLRATDERVEAIKNAPIPTTVTQLKSFLGMVNFYCKFIPNASNVLQPLYNLLKKSTQWLWDKKCNKSFEKVKDMLMSNNVLTHFDPNKPVKLTVDASNFAVGAYISHIFENGFEKPIAFASRLLNPAEIKYSQIEKEALAIIFGVQKFFQYLYCKKFLLFTDHKPLLAIFNPKKGIPIFAANRLQRWAHILSAFDYDIQYVKSSNNYADFLSRLPDSQSENLAKPNKDRAITYVHYNSDIDKISYLNYVTDSKFPLDFTEIKKATQKDSILSKIIFYVNNGWPEKCNNPELLSFFQKKKMNCQ